MSINITNRDFIHLHCHSSFSAFDGLCPVETLAMKAREMGFPALALTDHGSVGGWIKFLKACTAKKDKKGKDIPYQPIKPLLGSEFYLCKNRFAKSKAEQPSGRKGNGHLVLIAKDWEGYQNICYLSNASWIESFYMDPRIDLQLLSEHSKGIVASSACLKNIINTSLLYGKYDVAKSIASDIKDIFGDDFFLEIMYHGIDEQKIILSDILKLGVELDIPVIATNDVHYLKKDQASSHELLMCMSSGRCINDPKRLVSPYHEFYLKSAEEMAKVFGSCPQVLFNTLSVAERVDTNDIEKHLFSGMRLPPFDVPSGFKSPYEYLTHLATEGLKKLGWDKSPKHVEAFNKEMGDIKIAYENNNYDFATYFLIVWDFINYAKSKGILTGPGRGSIYASVVSRCLGITYGYDPLESGLWERFLGFKNSKFVKSSDFYS